MHFGRQNIVDLVIEQITAFLANPDELAYLLVLFLDDECQNFLRWWGCYLSGLGCPNAILR
jgi:hypothetical protein